MSYDSIVGDYSNVNPGVHLAGNVDVRSKAYIGMGANIIQGLSVGERSVIGAGAVVITDVPADTRAVGVPAQATLKRSDAAESIPSGPRDSVTWSWP